MNYSKTFAAVIVIFLGWLGVGRVVSETELGTILDLGIQLVGMVWVIVERIRKGGVTVLGFRK